MNNAVCYVATLLTTLENKTDWQNEPVPPLQYPLISPVYTSPLLSPDWTLQLRYPFFMTPIMGPTLARVNKYDPFIVKTSAMTPEIRPI